MKIRLVYNIERDEWDLFCFQFNGRDRISYKVNFELQSPGQAVPPGCEMPVSATLYAELGNALVEALKPYVER